MTWTVRRGGDPKGPAQRALAVEIDPRTQTVTLAWRTLGLGDAEVGSRALYRGFIEHVITEDQALAWLEGPQAATLLASIEEGYQASMTWSGDWVARWTAEAWTAAEDLLAGVRALH